MESAIEILRRELGVKKDKINLLKDEVKEVELAIKVLLNENKEEPEKPKLEPIYDKINVTVRKADNNESTREEIKSRVIDLIRNGFDTGTFTITDIVNATNLDHSRTTIAKALKELSEEGIISERGFGDAIEYYVTEFTPTNEEIEKKKEYLKKKRKGWKEEDTDNKSSVLANRILKCFDNLSDPSDGLSIPEIMDILKDETSVDRATYYNAMAKLETEEKVVKSDEKVNGRGANGRPTYVYTIREE